MRTTWAAPDESYDLKYYNIKVQINNMVELEINTTDTYVDFTPSVSGGGVSVVLPSGDSEALVVRPFDIVNVAVAAVTMCDQVGASREISINDLSSFIDFNNSGKLDLQIATCKYILEQFRDLRFLVMMRLNS